MDISKFQTALAGSNNILVVLSKDPDFDGVAAALSLSLSLSSVGKKTSTFCASPMLVEFNRLVGVDRITHDYGSKNMTVSLRDYPADNIERVSYNIENGEMQLTIIPKPGVTPPNSDQIVSSYGGLAADMVILVGMHNEEQIGSGELQEEIKKVPTVVSFVQGQAAPIFGVRRNIIEFSQPGVSSLSELIGVLLTDGNLPLDQDIANNLLSGITTTTRNYTTSKVRPETFEVSAKLLRLGGSKQVSTPVEQVSQPPDQQEEAPQEWLEPKVFKGNTLP